VNKYRTGNTYFIQRLDSGSSSFTCFSRSNSTNTSTVFKNIADASRKTSPDYQTFTEDVQEWLHQYKIITPTTIFSMKFATQDYWYFCQWGVTAINYYLMTSYYQVVVGAPYVG
jgi:hypothetical protein